MPRGIPAGQAYFTLTLNDQVTKKITGVGSRIKATMDRIKQSAAAVGAAMLRVFQAMTKLAIAAGAAVLAMAAKFAKAGDMFGKMAVRTGIGAEALQELSYAAQISGTNINSLSQAIFRVRRRIGNAAMGTGPSVRALKELNLRADELARMSPEDMFERLVGALQAVGNEAQRNQLAFELFGDNFREIQPLIAQGADNIARLREEARNMGLVISEEQIKSAQELTDSFTRLRSVIDILQIKFGALFGPALGEILDVVASKLATLTEVLDGFFKVAEIGWAGFKLEALEAISAVYEPLFKLGKLLPGRLGTASSIMSNNMGFVTRQARADLLEAMTRSVLRPAFDRIPVPALEPPMAAAAEQEQELRRWTEVVEGAPQPASTGILSGFAASMASAMRFNQGDPKKEEKEMVEILRDIQSDGLIVGAGDGG